MAIRSGATQAVALVMAAAVITTSARSKTNVNNSSAQVCAVLATYKTAVERLNLSGTDQLFVADSRVYESGGSEGNYANYLEHHLIPEFADFKAFHYEDYHCDVSFEGGVALANEVFRYRIELKSGQFVERGGVQTSVLRRVSAGAWQIVSLHISSRKPK